MILSELKSIKELNLNMADGYILNVSSIFKVKSSLYG